MDNIPIEYRDRMLAEQMVMIEALQFVAQILICFVLLVAFLILIVNLSDIVRTRLSERRLSEHLQPQSRAARQRGSGSRLEKIEYETEKEVFKCETSQLNL
jgi:hypothetical protein